MSRREPAPKRYALVSSTVTARLRYLPPYDWAALVDFFRARAIDGVERVDGDGDAARYRRSFAIDGAAGTVEVAHLAARCSLTVTIRGAGAPAARLPIATSAILARARRVFDLDADVSRIAAHFASDGLLAPLIARRPGLRIPGGWDGFELAIRAVLGQQVTVDAARRLAGQLVALCGASLPAIDGISRIFPTAARVAAADLSTLGMPGARRATLRAIAEAARTDPALFTSLSSIEDTVARLRTIRGIGDWTAHYIALRAAREPDAFPASDIGLLRGATQQGVRPTPAELTARAERWRPWRAYAAQHLWSADVDTRTKGKP